MKKRSIAFLLALAGLLLAVPAGAQGVAMYVLCLDEINIRSAATTHSPVAGRLFCGDLIWMDKSEVDNQGREWCHFMELGIEAGEGWACDDYLVYDPVTVYEDGGAKVTVAADGRVAVRKTVGGKRTCWLQPGDEVTVYAQSAVWSITDKGYIKTDYLEVDES